MWKYSDEDMQSIISMISVNNNLDVAPLDDLEDIPDIESLSGDISEHVLDFTQQLEQLTSSLTGSELPTPISGEFISEAVFLFICNSLRGQGGLCIEWPVH